MKKTTLIVLFLSTLWGYSQVKNYTFTQSNGTYTAITGGTSLGNKTSDQEYFVDPASPLGGTTFTGAGFPIGFNFIFNGYSYDRFAVNANGWIALGSTAFAPAVNARAINVMMPMTTATSPTPEALAARIVPLGQDLQGQANSNIRFQVIGRAPNRVLVIQWKNYRRYTATSDSFNFQIRLKETSNIVEFVYGAFTASPSASNISDLFQIGMRAEISGANFINRTSTTGWADTTPGTALGNSITMTNAIKPSNGLTYKWTPSICSDPKTLLPTNVTPTGATLSWSSYLPASNSFEYAYSTSATLPTAAGTAVNASTATVTGLTPFTKYYVFVRSVCGATQFTPWINVGNFTTRCNDVSDFTENFDSYITGAGKMPNCWFAAGNGTTYIATGGGNPGTAPNRLYMEADASASIPKIGYAVMPPVSNLNAGTYRLKFKAHAYFADQTFDVGYFTNIDDLASFQILKTISLPSGTAADAQDFIVIPPTTIPAGIKNLVFRNAGTGKVPGFVAVYIDDVIWQPNPACTDVKNVLVKLPTSNSVNLSWDVTGTETAWQYAVSSSTVTDPTTLPDQSFIDVALASVTGDVFSSSKRTMTINNLTPNTSYKIWVRSKCGDSAYGLWSASPIFLTPCGQVATIHEDFDASATLPNCWRKGNASGTASIELGVEGTSSNSLKLVSPSATNAVWCLLPSLSTTAAGYRLRFNFKASKSDTQFQIVSLQDPLNIIGGTNANFTVLKTIPITEANASYVFSEGLMATAPDLAFKIWSGSDVTTVKIDDLAWEPIPTCPDVTDVVVNGISSESAEIGWTSGGVENDWQYALTNEKVSDPSELTAADFVSPFLNGSLASYTISDLTPSTNYKLWIRSKCSPSDFGVWVGPYYFTTNCAVIDGFVQDFDASTDFPACWSKVGATGTVAVIDYPGTSSSPNVLKLDANINANAVAAMQPLSNTADGTKVLRFKLSGSVVGAKVEVGYVTNPQDATKFFPLKTFTVGSITDYSIEIADLGFEPASQVLAFRNPGIGTTNSSVYIDDVAWEPLNATILGVDTFDGANFSFYPNPVKEILNISLDKEITNATIVNLLGQEVIAKSVNSKQVKIDMSELTAGIYLVKITADNQTKTVKVMKK